LTQAFAVQYNWPDAAFSEDRALAEEEGSLAATEEQAAEVERLRKRLDLLDQRLDSIDSMVTAVAERVMSRPLTVNVVCPHCGKGVEIALIGTEKPTR
jgi:hypothetical protein